MSCDVTLGTMSIASLPAIFTKPQHCAKKVHIGLSVLPWKSSETGPPLAPTVNFTPLLATPPTVTTTFPVVAPFGTATVMLVALQLDGVPAVPLNVTVLVLCVAWKPVPVIVTTSPIAPVVGFKLVMLGADGVTVKLTPLLAVPPTVTTTFPVVAPVGIGTVIVV